MRSQLLAIGILLTILVPTFAADDTSTPDLLPQGSTWAGEKDGDERHANSKTVPVRLTITERNDDTFTARFVVATNPRRAVELRGKVNDKGIIRAQVVSVVEGRWADNIKDIIWEGAVRDDTLKLQYAPRGDRVQSMELKLTERKRGRGKGGER